MKELARHALAFLTFEEARDVLERGAVALLPTGAIEAHGPHLPLSTDVLIAERAAQLAAELLLERDPLTALVLPPLAYSVAEYAGDFRGTISIRPDTARALVRDVVLGAVRTGFRGVVLCNAHLEPANLEALREGAEDARREGAKVAFPDVTRKPHALCLGDEFKSGACHAGSYETSLVLAYDSALVRQDIGRALAENPASLSVAIREGKKTFLQAGGAQAYFGNPAAGTAAEGNERYQALADIFATAAREVWGT